MNSNISIKCVCTDSYRKWIKPLLHSLEKNAESESFVDFAAPGKDQSGGGFLCFLHLRAQARAFNDPANSFNRLTPMLKL